MLKKITGIALAVLALAVLDITAAPAGGSRPECSRLAEKAGGEMVKYSLDAEVSGLVFFADIGCGIRYRNKELCAMEMISFDSSAKVYDYHTAEGIDINKAFFWLDENEPQAPILAFSTKEAADRFGAEKGGGATLDYTSLTEKMLR